MHHFCFDTDGFQDTPERLLENFNEIGGFTLCETLQVALIQAGFQTKEIFPEDYGWAFEAELGETMFFCSASIDPHEKDDQSGFSHFGNLNIERRRSFKDRLLRRNKMSADDPATIAIKAALQDHSDVHNLKLHLT